MRELLKAMRAGPHARLGAVLHVGAGACVELPDFQGLEAEKILLVEANPELSDRLLRRLRGVKQVQVLNAAAVAQPGESATLRVLNNSRESSLLPPARLLEYFPNLRVAREVTVPAAPLARLIRRLAPDPAQRNLLLLETAGMEAAVLAATPPEELQKFFWIAVRASTEALYEGGARLEELDAALTTHGYRRVTPEPDPGLPFQNVLYELDPRRVLDELEEENRELNRVKSEQAAQLEAEREERAKSEARLKEERAKSEASLEQELTEARQTAALTTKLQALREADLKDLQGRYREALTVQEKQHEMLVKVAERLKAASQYFHQMVESEKEAPRPIEEKPPAGPARKGGR